jgi:hypothetical protein
VSVELTVALISAAAAVLAALLTVVVSARTTRVTAELQDKLERQRHQASKEELLEQVMSRYREPLVRAAFDLQSRIYNIVKQAFLVRYLRQGRPDEQEYACRNTVFVVAEYLGWVEILRRGVQFLDLGDVERNRSLVDRLEAISTVLLDDRQYPDSTFQVFRGQQRAVGELMMDPAPPSEGMAYRQCIGYAAFVAELEQEPSFARWFAKLEGDVQQVAADPSPGYDRLVALQHALIDLIDFLDDPPTRFPQKHRGKI